MAEIKEVKLTNPLYQVKESNVNQIGLTTMAFLKTYKLEKGTTVTFRLLQKRKNSDPKKKEGEWIYPNISLRTQFWINDKDNGVVEIAAVKSVNRDNTYVIKDYHVDATGTNGLWVMYGDIVEDQKLFPYLMLSPENRTSIFHNSEISEPLYEVVNAAADAKKSVNRVSILLKCLRAISEFDNDDLKLYNTAFGGNVHDEPVQMMDRLNNLATKDPEDFYVKIDAPTIRSKSVIKMAGDLNIIQYDPMQHRYLWVGGDTIAALDRVDGKEPIDLFAEWLTTSKNGDKIQKMIELKLK